MWAAMLPLAFAACSQEEIVENSSASVEAVAQYKGAQLIENPSFTVTKDGEGVASRMTTTNGVVDWEAGDKVGLVWLNAMAISDNYESMKELSDLYPTSKLHFSNTRITHGENSVFSMQDGQLYAGQYIAYHPYDENMKQVGQFSLKQDSTQSQTTSAVVDDAAYDYLAKNMNWLSRSANNATGKSSFLYHIDANKAGLVKTIHIPMRRYSNIFESRFVGEEPTVSRVKWEDLTIQKVELIADANVFPTEVAFDFSKGLNQATYELERDADGDYIEIAATEFDKDGNPIKNYKEDATGYPAKFVVGLQQVGPTASYPALSKDAAEEWYNNITEKLANSITLNIDNQAAIGNNADAQRAMFLLLPTAEATDGLSIKIYTDYGYVIIDESEWKAYVGKDPDPVVNGTNWGSQDLFQNYEDLAEAGKTATDLLSLIGQKITRYVSVNPDDLVYNDIEVSNMDDLTAALKKWNDLGESGEFRVIVKSDNNFENFDWASNSSNEEIREFIADKDELRILGERVVMNLSGTTTLNDPQHVGCDGHLSIETLMVEQLDGEMNVLADETLTCLEIEVDAELNVNVGVELTVNKDNVNLKGEAVIDGTLNHTAEVSYSTSNSGVLTVNGTIKAKTFATIGNSTTEVTSTGKIETSNYINLIGGELNIAQNGIVETANMIISPTTTPALVKTNGIINVTGTLNNFEGGVFRIKTFSETNVGTFNNEGEIYYDEQGKKFKYTNMNGGKSIATILSGDNANTLSDYIINANDFKCTDLVINPNDFLTTGQWDNSLNDKKFGFKTVVMNDGVTIQFNKNLNMSSATVEIPADATVEWKKGDNLNTPVFKINKLAVNSGSTLNVSGINVENAKKTDVNFGNEGKTVTINGMGCFAVEGATPVGDNTNGTIITNK